MMVSKMEVDGSAQGSKGIFQIPWVELYRPQILQDVEGNEDAVSRLMVIAQDGNMPNLLLSGPPGTGKTTSIMCLARELLGPKYKEAILELNASDDRGIDVVRNKIKMFAQTTISLPEGSHKIIVLDEADSMTSGAQQALRRIMELYSNTTRFAMICNQSTKIIEPIQSRCAMVRYTRLQQQDILQRLLKICQQERVSYTDDGLEALIFVAEGDMRQAINNLQSTFAGFGHVSQENVYKVCDQPHPLVVQSIVRGTLQLNMNHSYSLLKGLLDDGYSVTDIIGTIFRVTRNFNKQEMPEFVQLEILKEIGICHMRIGQGVNTELQLSGLLAKMCKVVLQSRR